MRQNMVLEDIISSHLSLQDRLSICQPPHALTRWVRYKITGIRLAMHYGEWSWMRPAPVGARLDDATAACWLRHIPISPYHFHMTLFDEVIGGERCIVAIDEDGNGGFRFSVEEGERVVLEGHRYWSLARGSIFHGMIRADMRREDQMLPTRVLRNSFELYHELAIQEVYLSAGYERGGYVWAKFGFMPESKSSWTAYPFASGEVNIL
jgi:hypothetical protein